MYSSLNVVTVVKRKLRWAGYVAGMDCKIQTRIWLINEKWKTEKQRENYMKGPVS